MSSLASRLLGCELLTLPEFMHDVEARLAFHLPGVEIARPRPGVLAVSWPGKHAVEFNLQSSYRGYQRDPRAKDEAIAQVLRWIEAGAKQRTGS